MTSKVTVEAHCADDKQVLVEIGDLTTDKTLEQKTLQNGEKAEFYVHDDRAIAVCERLKEKPAEETVESAAVDNGVDDDHGEG